MTRRPSSTAWPIAALVGGVLALAPTGDAGAQSGGRGFSFQPPRGGISIRGGLTGARAGGDLFDFTTGSLTLDQRDFRSATVAVDLAWTRPGSRLDVVVGSGFATASAPSEFRDLVGEDDLPIAQTTTFRRVPVTAGLRAYLLPRGRSIGRFAWVPNRVAPYVGAGVGATWYRFRQQGEFVDYETLDVFRDDFQSEGWGPTGYGHAGIDLALGVHVALTAEARYTYAKAAVGGDFDGFDSIDLSGLATTVGFTFRF